LPGSALASGLQAARRRPPGAGRSAQAARRRPPGAVQRAGSPRAPAPQERAYLSLADIEHEALNHSSLRHPHVIQFREVFLSQNHFNM
jgi:hypothetical protein